MNDQMSPGTSSSLQTGFVMAGDQQTPGRESYFFGRNARLIVGSPGSKPRIDAVSDMTRYGSVMAFEFGAEDGLGYLPDIMTAVHIGPGKRLDSHVFEQQIHPCLGNALGRIVSAGGRNCIRRRPGIVGVHIHLHGSPDLFRIAEAA